MCIRDRKNIERGEQSILFLNRRGSARMLLCGECGYVPQCPRCSVPMTYHSANERLMCHYCGHSEAVVDRCSECGGLMKRVGSGTQKVEQELFDLFPKAKVLRMDADTVGASRGHEALLREFEEKNIPILLGTQMVAKGLDFENVTLVGVLDADITGPSVPKSFGVHSRAMQDGECLLPAVTDGGIKLMSINLLLESESAPVVWRGPVISGVINQFWSDVRWGELDYLFVDMPPGTGDVALTVFQGLPVDGIVIVTTPQDLVQMIVEKAFNMAKMMKVPVLGLVENMSAYVCPDCGKSHPLFGTSKVEETAAALGVPVLAKLPLDPAVNALVDAGRVEDVQRPELQDFIDVLKGYGD